MLTPTVDPDALLCALVLAPQSYARNRFFGLFQDPRLGRVRRRAARVRGIIRQLLSQGESAPELLGEQRFADGRLLVRYRMARLGFVRTASLTPLEASLVRYALHRAQGAALPDEDRDRVQWALHALGPATEALIGAGQEAPSKHPSGAPEGAGRF